MSMAVTIRNARAGDAACIAALCGQLGYPMEAAAARRAIAKFAHSATDMVVVAEARRKVVGVLAFHITPLLHTPGQLGRITALVVDEGWRSMGIGAKLVHYAETWAWKHGCEHVEVTSNVKRRVAHRFYLHRGYEHSAKRFTKRNPLT